MRKTGLRLLLLLLLPLLFLSFTGPGASAAGSGKIVLDNKELVLPQGVVLESTNGSVMIPIRVVVENLGFEVQWEQKTRKVIVRQDGKSVELAVGSRKANADGVTLDLNAAPKQTGGTVLVPIRFVSEQFGLKVGWDNSDKTVYLTGSSSGGNEGADSTGEGSGIVVDAPVIPGGNETPVITAQIKGAAFSENRLMIAVTGAAKPTVTSMTNPNRIVVDFPDTSVASDFTGGPAGESALGNQQGKLDITGYPQVSEIRYALFSTSPSIVRFVIQTNAVTPYQISTDEGSGLTTIDLNISANTEGDVGGTEGKGNPVVVLDAGHGGTQPGAVSITKRLEKNFNLAVIRKAESLLQQESGITVILTRGDDSTLGLQDRVTIAESAKADLFISLHANAMPPTYTNWGKVNGSETYYSRSESLPLAQIMHKHLLVGTGFKDNGVRSKSLHVTRETSMPAVLLEAGYLTHAGDEASMYSEAFQDALAQEIVAGIKEYLGL
ncbi:N-acetylmuramoyl-L-alanine amidase [Paenibacillus sp. BR2-3]|uniref:N-acetylmuramoyl-L-alanine amidase n=1 Tax=Paenibacillus sp. BR2-3 TaxID=3048494 RepID=UPI0039773335